MSSAPVGTRIVARALPGRGGSAARARASAACLAAWRAAQGAAPRRPSLRLRGPSSFPAAPPAFGWAAFAPAAGFIDADDLRASIALGTVAFFVFAMSLSVRCKAPGSLQPCARSPPVIVRSLVCPRGGLGRNALGHLPESSGGRLPGKCAPCVTVLRSSYASGADMAVLTPIDKDD